LLEKKLIGVKATIDSLNYLKDLILLIKSQREEFSVLTGFESYLVPNLISGGDGGIVALSNFAPDLMKKAIIDFENKDFDSVNETHRRILKLSEIYKNSSSFAGAIKISLNLLGFPIKRKVRIPLLEDDEDRVEKIKDILSSLKLL
ncbi:MAG: dihydrodipicolinate synthase family protein, partial [Caldisericia bacterium]|nr:dihydrodipicolinate synthase family protein [Caldisericia bacterium]